MYPPRLELVRLVFPDCRDSPICQISIKFPGNEYIDQTLFTRTDQTSKVFRNLPYAVIFSNLCLSFIRGLQLPKINYTLTWRRKTRQVLCGQPGELELLMVWCWYRRCYRSCVASSASTLASPVPETIKTLMPCHQLFILCTCNTFLLTKYTVI